MQNYRKLGKWNKINVETIKGLFINYAEIRWIDSNK